MELTMQNQAGAQAFILMPQGAFDALTESINELKSMISDKSKAEADHKWIESSEARKLLGVSQKTWQTYRDNRVIPFSQFGRKIYVRRDDIDKYLQSHMQSR